MASSKKTRFSANKRRSNIIELIKSDQEVLIPDLASRFGVSEMTVRRDLDILASVGEVERTHGGAAIAEKLEFEFDFGTKRKANQKYKKAIALAAMKLIKPPLQLILDTGTTTLELAYLIRDKEDITVLTTSLAVASVLQFSGGIETILLGGRVRRGSADLTGVLTAAFLDKFIVDIAFQGADGISLEGEMFNDDAEIASIDSKMRQRAKETFILCDSSKIGISGFASNGFLSETNGLITDNRITKKDFNALRKKGVKITITD